MKSLRAPPPIARFEDATRALLASGGDDRISVDPVRGENRYGCSLSPDPTLAAFGSSTASSISEAGFAAAQRLHARLVTPNPERYIEALRCVQQGIAALCGVEAGSEIILAASGTDLHLLAAELVGVTALRPTRVVFVDPAETGSLVPLALEGKHFGRNATEGTRLHDGASLEIMTVATRTCDGGLRKEADVDAEFVQLVDAARRQHQRVLLVLNDTSKSGLIVPSVACVDALCDDHDDLDVLVDACQFRVSSATIQSYLTRGFMVAVTGSKFVTGPAFSGALLIPAALVERFRKTALPRDLGVYAPRSHWPRGWTSDALPEDANVGLLLRWEAALVELRAFRAVPEAWVAQFLSRFQHAVRARLAGDPVFEPLEVRPLERGRLHCTGAPERWDQVQTIFPFVLRSSQKEGARGALPRDATAWVHRALMEDTPDGPRSHLGQPIAAGTRGGVPTTALRLCCSARLVVEASQRADAADAILARMTSVLDRTAARVQRSAAHGDRSRYGTAA